MSSLGRDYGFAHVNSEILPHSIGDINMDGHKITNLGVATLPADAVTKAQLDVSVGACLPISGGTLTGDLNFGSDDYSISKTDTTLHMSSLGSMYFNCGSTDTLAFSEISLSGSTVQLKNGAGGTNILLNNDIEIDAGDGSISLNAGGNPDPEILINNNGITFNTTTSSNGFLFKSLGGGCHVFVRDDLNNALTIAKQPSDGTTSIRTACVEIRNDDTHSNNSLNILTQGNEFDPNMIVHDNLFSRRPHYFNDGVRFGDCSSTNVTSVTENFKIVWDSGRLEFHDTNNNEDAMYLTAHEAVLPRRITLRNPTPDNATGGAGYCMEATTGDTLTINNSASFSGGVIMGSKLNMSSFKIENLAQPTSNSDAATKLYVDNFTHPIGASGQHVNRHEILLVSPSHNLGTSGNYDYYVKIPDAEANLSYSFVVTTTFLNDPTTAGLTACTSYLLGYATSTYLTLSESSGQVSSNTASDAFYGTHVCRGIIKGSHLKTYTGGRQLKLQVVQQGYSTSNCTLTKLHIEFKEIVSDSYSGSVPDGNIAYQAWNSAFNQGTLTISGQTTEP